eukprot:g2559.t1
MRRQSKESRVVLLDPDVDTKNGSGSSDLSDGGGLVSSQTTGGALFKSATEVNDYLSPNTLTVKFKSIPRIFKDGQDKTSPDTGITSEEVFARWPFEELSILKQLQSQRKQLAKGFGGDVDVPSVKIRMMNLSMTVKASTKSSGASNVLNAFTSCFERKETVDKDLLRNINACFNPKEFTLLLGPPGAGKTVLLRSIAGLVSPREMKQSGTVLYNSRAMDETFKRDLPSIVGYVDQRDQHYPLLTVKETLMFAQDCMMTHNRIKSPTELVPKKVVVRALDRPSQSLVLEGRAAQELRCHIIMTMLGIGDCADTVVGDELIRGISGGQKKRVTIGEMIVGGRPVILLDEITTGLDSSTAFDIVQSFKRINHVFGYTVVAALLQPPPEVYDLFDNVMLMDRGQIMFHGPRKEVMKHFNSLGYVVPERMDVADFLQQITLPEGARFLKDRKSGKHLSRREFAKSYETTFEDIEKVAPRLPPTLHYSQSPLGSAVTLFRRQWILTTRNKTFAISQIMQSLIQGLLIGTTFYDLEKSDYITRFGFVFTATMALSLAAMAQIPQIIKERTVYYKQRSANFFRTRTYVWASVLTQIPFNLVCTTLMSVLVYFLTGMHRSIGAFFFFWLILFFLSLGMGLLFKFFAASMPDATSAQGLASCSVLILVLMSGYIIQQHEIKDYFIWLYYLSPLQWGYSALMINEFESGGYDEIVSVGGSSRTYGDAYLGAYQMHTSESYKWYGLFYTIGLCVFGFFGMWWAYHFCNYSAGGVAGVAENEESAVDEGLGKAHDRGSLSDPLLGDRATKEGEESKLADNVEIDVAADDEDLDFVPVNLAFKNLVYTVELTGEAKGTTRDLLKKVNGYAKPGRLTALMGSTGAGKSTLLDVLAGRKNTGVIKGTVSTNGYLKDDDVFSTICGYVEQVDIHSPTATVAEALNFSATLRLPSSTIASRRERFVKSWIRRLDLSPIATRRIGQLDKPGGLSIEQRKRVTIGVELVANPSVVFLDEPTSGLDARAAMIVLKALKAISKSGRTVICTIHQPSAELFRAFQDLLLMKKGGQVVYFGELGTNCSKLIQYFEAIPGTPKIRPHYNPATWMLEVIGGGVGSDASDPDKYARLWRSSSLCRETQKVIDEMVARVDDEATGGDDDDVASKELSKMGEQLVMRERVGKVDQMKAVVSKAITSYWRTPSYNSFRLFLNVVVGVLVGAIFFNTFENSYEPLQLPGNLPVPPGIDIPSFNTISQAKAMSGISFCFLSAAFCGVININTVMAVVMNERSVFYREKAVKMYDAYSYSFGMFVSEIPYICLQGVIYVAIAYPMVGFPVNEQNDFWTGICTFYVPFLIYLQMATYFGQFIACIMPTQDAATIIASLINTIWNIFAGFLIARDKIPIVYLVLYYLSPIRYALEPLIMSQYWCDGCAKNQDELKAQAANATHLEELIEIIHMLFPNQTIPDQKLEFPTVLDSSCDPSCTMFEVTTPEGIQLPVFVSDFATSTFGFEYDKYWRDVIIVAAFAVGWRILCTLTLRYVNHQKR